MLTFAEFRNIRKTYLIESRVYCRQVYKVYTNHKKDSEDMFGCGLEGQTTLADLEHYIMPKTVGFAPLPQAVPAPNFMNKGCKKQEGNKPMRYNDNYASATAAITATKTDASVQREYFQTRLDQASYPKDAELQKLFNLHVNNSPKSFQALIDAIKGGKYTIDKKAQAKYDDTEDKDQWYYGATYGFIWDGPQPDYKGYELALTEKAKQFTSAKDTIMSGDAAAMKAAVEAFEAWTPTTAAN